MQATISRNNKPSNKGSKTLFKNKFLESLSKTHIAVPITILSAFSLFLMYWGVTEKGVELLTILGLFGIGFLTFTFIEYLVHRYVFHMSTYTAFRKKMQYAFHGVHHDFPKDKQRLAMPPLVSGAISTVLFLLFRFLMGEAVFGFLPGFLIGYNAYLGVHYAVHAYQPPKNAFKILWVNHGIHHYKDHDRAFGVSSPLWDYVFRTLPHK